MSAIEPTPVDLEATLTVLHAGLANATKVWGMLCRTRRTARRHAAHCVEPAGAGARRPRAKGWRRGGGGVRSGLKNGCAAAFPRLVDSQGRHRPLEPANETGGRALRLRGAFDPETIATLIVAYDNAIEGQPASAREAIARSIIELAAVANSTPASYAKVRLLYISA